MPPFPAAAPRAVSLAVIPVAGRGSMLLELSGAQAPFFTRKLHVPDDDAGPVQAPVPGWTRGPHRPCLVR